MSVLTEAKINKMAEPMESSTKKLPVAEENTPERYLDVSVLGNSHHMKLIQVIDIITHHRLGRYLKVTNCAFLHYCNTDILAIDIRKEPEDVEKVTVVIAEVLYEEEKKSSLLGFVINSFEEFCERISFVGNSSNVKYIKGNCIPAFWWDKSDKQV